MDNQKPKLNLSIIVPTLNVAKTIRLTLESLQPLKELGAKIILVDSFSTDDTVKLAKEYCDCILQYPKGNMYAAINEGIKNTDTEWVSYLNADDIIYSDIIIKTFESISAEVDFFYGDLDFIDWNGRFLHSYVFSNSSDIISLAAESISSWSPIGTFYKREVWEKLNGYDTDYKYSADFDFMLRAKLANFNFMKIKKLTVGAFRLHPNQLSQHDGNPGLQENHKMIKKLNISVPMIKRIFAKWRFKCRNFWEYLIRILRKRKLTDRANSYSCITPPNYEE